MVLERSSKKEIAYMPRAKDSGVNNPLQMTAQVTSWVTIYIADYIDIRGDTHYYCGIGQRT